MKLDKPAGRAEIVAAPDPLIVLKRRRQIAHEKIPARIFLKCFAARQRKVSLRDRFQFV